MLAAHMDEIGLQVTKIESDGRLRVAKVGWVWAGSVYNDKLIFQKRRGRRGRLRRDDRGSSE